MIDDSVSHSAMGAPITGARRVGHLILRYGAMVFGVAVLVQIYLAGAGIFAAAGPVSQASSLDAHRLLGNILAGVAFLLLIAMIVARPRRRVVVTVVALFVLTGVEGLLATAGGTLPYLGALHPVVAVLIVGLTVRTLLLVSRVK
jgi:hypothetical protein